MTNDTNTTPVNFAMQAGIFLGALGIVKFLLLIFTFDAPVLGLLYIFAALFFHFVIYNYARKFKNTEMEGNISFFQAWNVSILMYFFGAILSGAVEFMFYKFINPSFLSHYISKSIASVQQFSAMMQDASTKSLLNEIAVNLAKGGIPTPIEMVFGHIQNTVFSGLFVSLIIAAILIRKKSNKNNSQISTNNDNTL